MPKHSAPPWFPTLDANLTHIGRAVSPDKAILLGHAVNHCHSHIRKGGFTAVYPVDRANGSGPSIVREDTIQHQWQWRTGPKSKWAHVRVLTLGGSADLGVIEPTLRVVTVADATGQVMDPVPFSSGTFDDDFPALVKYQQKIVAIDDDADELLKINQDDPNSHVRILAIAVDELPSPLITPTTTPDIGLNLFSFMAGEDIIDSDYVKIPDAVQDCRCYNKKILFQSAKYLTNDSGASGTFIDVFTQSSSQILRWDLYPSSYRHSATDELPIEYRILAKSNTTANSIVRLDFARGDTDITLTSTTLGLWPAAGPGNATIYGTAAESVAVLCDKQSAASVEIYGIWIWEDVETV